MNALPEFALKPIVLPDPAPTNTALEVSGLTYKPGYLSDAEQREMLQCVDGESWMTDLSRRVQHYGWRYDYREKTVSREMKLGALPVWLQGTAKRLHDEEIFDRTPDQVIVNEYEPGQGIALHADRNCFGPVVVTISLGDDWEMRFRPVSTKSNAADKTLMLECGSVVVLAGDARHKWMHGIDRRKVETDGNGRRSRSRRVSLTFRTVLTEQVVAAESITETAT